MKDRKLERSDQMQMRSNKKLEHTERISKLSTMVGAIILARAVDDEAFSKEVLREARRGLA